MQFRSIVMLLVGLYLASSLSAETEVKSREIEVRGRRFRMECNDKGIFLSSADLEGENRKLSMIPQPETVKSKVLECRISPWRSQTGIAAVVREKSEGKNRYTALVMILKEDGELGQFKRSGLIHETEEDWSILSVDGMQSGDSMITVLGEFDDGAGFTQEGNDTIFNSPLKRGVILFDGCPNPPTMARGSYFSNE